MSLCLSVRRARVICTVPICLLILQTAAAPAAAQEKPPPPPLTDERVDKAVKDAVAYIKGHRNADGSWEGVGRSEWRGGDTALACLALLYAGENPNDADMSRSLDWLSSASLDATYTYSVRTQALSLVPGKKYRPRLQSDMDWLIKAVNPRGDGEGGYDYHEHKQGNVGWDNSNSQYGVLGVWMAVDAGLSAPAEFWTLIHDHWTTNQNADGGWGYKKGGDSSGSMTAAGLASMFVVFDQLYNEKPKDAGRLLSVIASGLEWLSREYSPRDNPHGDTKWYYYYLYGIERVGRASGYKYFGNKEWFREGATLLLSRQAADGSWESDLHNTCFVLLFLCHGRAPLLFNKLQHGDDWNNKPRDVAGLNRYAQHAFERLLNWQIVKLDGTLDDLMEAPVLYLTGETNWQFTDAQAQKIREYCQRGGLLFAVAGNDSEEFSKGVRELAQKAFPEYPLRTLDKEHPLYGGVQYEIKKPIPLEEVNNGIRTLILLSPKDIAESWSKYRVKNQEESFQLGCNVYLYATDKSTIKSRLVTTNIAPKPLGANPKKISVARIEYTGKATKAWDVEPYGWTRLGHYLNNEANTRLLVTSNVKFDSPNLSEFKIAFMSGTDDFTLSPSEAEGLRKFITGGGTLLADAAGGSPAFLKAFEREVAQALNEKNPPKLLSADSFMFTKDVPDGVEVTNPTYRRTARTASRGRNVPPIKVFEIGKRLGVIYSTIDLSSGMLGTYAFNIRGLEGDSALHMMRNMLMYASLNSAQKGKLK